MVGRRRLASIAGIVTPETILRWYRRLVAKKYDGQLDLRVIHRVRIRLVRRRTAVINQLRAFLLERGVTFPAATDTCEARGRMPGCQAPRGTARSDSDFWLDFGPCAAAYRKDRITRRRESHVPQ
jgi:hypothetical protein